MSPPEITIKQGKLRGSMGTDIQGNNYYRFQGIPYAQPPIGSLRFKDPLPPLKWDGIFDATKEGDPCYSLDFYNMAGTAGGSENCLVLNVYTRVLSETNDQTLRPVLFWIHGGGFTFGSGSSKFYGPDLLLIEDVVVVTINYRLGMLGFLSLEDPSLGVSGNAGFKDMVMALKWVQNNIAHFDGDPDNVTIFGESAGGAAVHLLWLSPLSKGLFHRAIAQSGSALNPWVQGQKGVGRIAAAMGLEGSDEKSVYAQLMQKSVQEIYEIQLKIPDNFVASEKRPFGLVIETGSTGAEFFTEEPIKVIKSGKVNEVPFMAGYTTAEGMCFELFKNPATPDRPTLEDMIPWFLGYQIGSTESKSVAEKIKQFYYGSEQPYAGNIGKKYDILSDVMFIYGIYVSAINQFRRSKAPTYLYRVSIETELNFFKRFLKISQPGVSHLDDVGYLFSHFATPTIKPGSLEDTSFRRFVRLWTNFAKYGNPTPDEEDPLLNVIWEPVQGPELNFLDIGENLVMSSNPEPERINFWKQIFAQSPIG